MCVIRSKTIVNIANTTMSWQMYRYRYEKAAGVKKMLGNLLLENFRLVTSRGGMRIEFDVRCLREETTIPPSTTPEDYSMLVDFLDQIYENDGDRSASDREHSDVDDESPRKILSRSICAELMNYGGCITLR
jgi:hypothetical protein